MIFVIFDSKAKKRRQTARDETYEQQTAQDVNSYSLMLHCFQIDISRQNGVRQKLPQRFVLVNMFQSFPVIEKQQFWINVFLPLDFVSSGVAVYQKAEVDLDQVIFQRNSFIKKVVEHSRSDPAFRNLFMPQFKAIL